MEEETEKNLKALIEEELEDSINEDQEDLLLDNEELNKNLDISINYNSEDDFNESLKLLETVIEEKNKTNTEKKNLVRFQTIKNLQTQNNKTNLETT